MRVEYDDSVFRAALDRLAAGMDDMTEPMTQIGDWLVESTIKRFDSGIGPDGSPWAPNSPVTLARKKGSSPLVNEGNLKNSISQEAGPREVEISTSREYAGVQQFGAAQGAFGLTKRNGPIPWGNIPARPFIGLSDEDETAILDIVTEWLDGLAGAG